MNLWATYWSGSQSGDILPSMSVMLTYGSSAAYRASRRPAERLALPRLGADEHRVPHQAERDLAAELVEAERDLPPDGPLLAVEQRRRPGGLAERVGVEDAQRVPPLGLLVAGEVDLGLEHVEPGGDLGLGVHHGVERPAERQVDHDLAALVERVTGHDGPEPEVVGWLLRVGAAQPGALVRPDDGVGADLADQRRRHRRLEDRPVLRPAGVRERRHGHGGDDEPRPPRGRARR